MRFISNNLCNLAIKKIEIFYVYSNKVNLNENQENVFSCK